MESIQQWFYYNIPEGILGSDPNCTSIALLNNNTVGTLAKSDFQQNLANQIETLTTLSGLELTITSDQLKEYISTYFTEDNISQEVDNFNSAQLQIMECAPIGVPAYQVSPIVTMILTLGNFKDLLKLAPPDLTPKSDINSNYFVLTLILLSLLVISLYFRGNK